ncbi:hypothetical protein [Agrobacterium leguminum]
MAAISGHPPGSVAHVVLPMIAPSRASAFSASRFLMTSSPYIDDVRDNTLPPTTGSTHQCHDAVLYALGAVIILFSFLVIATVTSNRRHSRG